MENINQNQVAPFGPIFILTCDALGIDPTCAASALIKNVPKAEVQAVTDFDGVARIIAKAISSHVEAVIRGQRERGLTAPQVDATGADVDILYAAGEERTETDPNNFIYMVPGNGTIN